MPDFNVRADSVNVEQIMEQIRERIREKRGVDYTEQQIRELAAVKLEKFLDPRGVRSDLLDQFRKAQPAYVPPDLPNFAFEDATLFESHRAPIRWLRKLLMPLLKLLFNPNPLIQALHIQSRLNTMNAEREARQEAARHQMDQLYYELVHNLVLETTRTGIEVKNLKMRVESISSRLEFNERRARALEGAVVYKSAEAEEAPPQRPAPPIQMPRQQPPPRHQQQQPRYSPPPQAAAAPTPPAVPASVAAPAAISETPSPGQASGQTAGPIVPGEGPGQRSRRRRRRRGRRGGGTASAVMGAPGAAVPESTPEDQGSGGVLDQLDASDGMDDDDSAEPEGTLATPVEAPAVVDVAPSQVEPSHTAEPSHSASSHSAPHEAAVQETAPSYVESSHSAPSHSAPHETVVQE